MAKYPFRPPIGVVGPKVDSPSPTALVRGEAASFPRALHGGTASGLGFPRKPGAVSPFAKPVPSIEETPTCEESRAEVQGDAEAGADDAPRMTFGTSPASPSAGPVPPLGDLVEGETAEPASETLGGDVSARDGVSADASTEQISSAASAPPATDPQPLARDAISAGMPRPVIDKSRENAVFAERPRSARPTASSIEEDGSEPDIWRDPDMSILAAPLDPEPVWRPIFSGTPIKDELSLMARHTNVPEGVANACFLTVVGGLLGHRMLIEVGSTWHERPVIWSIIVAPSGSRKSSAARHLLSTVRRIEDEEARGWHEHLREVDRMNAFADAKMRAYRRVMDAAVAGDREPPPMPEVARTVLSTREPPQIVIDDITLARLAVTHAHPWNLAGLLALPDEIAPLLARLARSSEDRAALLRSHDAGPYRVDRLSRARVDIDNFTVSILGGAVDGRIVLGDVADGFSARTLWVAYRPGPDTPIQTEPLAMPATQKVLHDVRDLARRARTGPLRLGLTRDALAELDAIKSGWHERSAQTHGHFASWCARAPSHTLRLAALHETILAVSAGSAPEAIGSASIAAAASAVTHFFAPMAERVLDRAASGQQQIVRLARIVAKTASTDPDGRLVVNEREIYRLAGFQSPADLDFRRAWDALQRAGLVRKAARAPGKSGRQPGTFEVNPALLKAVITR